MIEQCLICGKKTLTRTVTKYEYLPESKYRENKFLETYCPEHRSLEEVFLSHGEEKYSRGLGSPCFIATAAYGSELDPRLDILRAFRDKVLIPNPIGNAFVKFYYKVSPPIADLIRPHGKVRAFIRMLLKPIVDAVEKKIKI